MNYPLENLDPERFQQFCQALLVREYPQVQCFPIAQPDGGRDAISYIGDQESSKFIVYQVKFSRKPFQEEDPQKWLSEVMKKEAPKLARLIPRGASRFHLITNIDGTAHLDSGTIDRLNRSMSEQLQVPFMCWWRDDVNRRLDNAWDLKWIYTDLMTGPDFLRWAFESGLSQDPNRRQSAIRAFLAQQLKADEQVRFRQIELQKGLLDLFVDVPIGFRDQGADSKQNRSINWIIQYLVKVGSAGEDNWDTTLGGEFEPTFAAHPQRTVGTATLLLSPLFQKQIPHCVLEGAPGQGKSTITQYVCQVHRLKLLKDVSLAQVPPRHNTDSSARLPIRIDLRDFATWLRKEDPFGSHDNTGAPPGWQKTLEAFIAALISFHSGGTHFTVDDFIAITKISSLLIVFDGLDEVADIRRRKEVVEEITKGVHRLEVNAASLQTIVTSRPAAFANSPGMPADKYPYLNLVSLTRSIINDYADRWLRARNVEKQEAVEFKQVLSKKLDQPHLRDLARNPMQLAILLSLILTRGSSLPDKRTALYDNYIDLFFNREAEKSPIVRDHRELLIDIHRYLAWVLHSESERGDSRGSMSQERLQHILNDYLNREGQDSRLASQLFTGMVERVVALVSRVEGTFEFEVQPLREYFAARYLYDTAPYSPPGSEQRGTKPDRFDVLASNFYWTNVTRFYCGCFSKGELPALVEGLQELASKEVFQYTAHPRMLAATLLGDWVFTQNPRSVKQVVELILDDLGLRYLLAIGAYSRRRRILQNPLALPPKCGRDQILAGCFSILRDDPEREHARDVADLAKANAENVGELIKRWAEGLQENPGKFEKWLRYSVELGVLSHIDVGRLEQLVGDLGRLDPFLLYRARRLDILESSELWFGRTVDEILNYQVMVVPGLIESPLDSFAHALNPFRYALVFLERAPVPLAELSEYRGIPSILEWDEGRTTRTKGYRDHEKCVEVAALANDLSKKSAAEWATEIEPWDQLVELGRSRFGERWVFFCLANAATGIRSRTERCAESSSLLDHTQSLCRRSRYARLASGQKWWERQFDCANSAEDVEFVCLIALTWATPKTLEALSQQLDSCLTALDKRSWYRLARAVRRTLNLVARRSDALRTSSFDLRAIKFTLSPRMAAALIMRVDEPTADSICANHLRGTLVEDKIVDEIVLEKLQKEALDLERIGDPSWSPDPERLRQCHLAATKAGISLAGLRRDIEVLPLPVARAIARQAKSFQKHIVALAAETCRRHAADNAQPVAALAEQQKWFGVRA